MPTAIRIRTEWVAVLVGLAIAAAFVSSWRVEGGGSSAPAKVEIVTSPSEVVAVSPEGVTAESQRLVPSLPEDGLRRQLTLRNATAEAIDVRVKATLGSPLLAEAVDAEVRAGSELVYRGPLSGLAAGSNFFALDPAESVNLDVVAWIPEGMDSEDWAGRSVSAQLQLVTRSAQ
jgi:hypothetical protein